MLLEKKDEEDDNNEMMRCGVVVERELTVRCVLRDREPERR